MTAAARRCAIASWVQPLIVSTLIIESYPQDYSRRHAISCTFVAARVLPCHAVPINYLLGAVRLTMRKDSLKNGVARD